MFNTEDALLQLGKLQYCSSAIKNLIYNTPPPPVKFGEDPGFSWGSSGPGLHAYTHASYLLISILNSNTNPFD